MPTDRRPRRRPGRRPSANPGRLLTGRGLHNLVRLRGGRIVRQSAHHLLMEWGDVLVTVPMLKGDIPHSTLRAIARTLEASPEGGRWRHLYT